MRYLCLLALAVRVILAQDGAAIYKERCSSCHDAPQGRVPSLNAIKGMSGEAIYRALTSGIMRTQAEGLSTAQFFALIGYIAPAAGAQPAGRAISRTCQGETPYRVDANAPQWNGWSASITNSRFQEAASAGLAVSDLPKLFPSSR